MFLFLKYIQPTLYYNLVLKVKVPIIYDSKIHKFMDTKLLSECELYHTKNAYFLDLAYQALQKGYIPDTHINQSILQNQMVVDIRDNYLFINRFFGRYKAFYVLFIRLLFFNNPLIEIKAFIQTYTQKKINLYDSHINYDSFLIFKSKLLIERPLVSIIIPTLNRYKYLKDVLADLEKQTYQNFEVLICDQSEIIDQAFYEGWQFSLTLLRQEEKALWLARNRCISLAKGNFILLFDDDSRVESNWIENHLRCLDYFDVSISAGITDTIVGHGLSPKERYFHLSDVFDTGNVMVRRKVFEVVGLFDRQFEKQRMGDGEFGMRALLAGFVSISNPYSSRIHLKVETGGLRQMGSWDSLRPKKLFAPRPIPSVLYYIRYYFGNENAFLYIIQNILYSYIPYKFKSSKFLKFICIILTPFLLLLVQFSVMRSWRNSTSMLKEGKKIPILN